MIFCGCFNSLILDEKNELYMCGAFNTGFILSNNNDKLEKYYNKFIKVENQFGKIKNIWQGSCHSVILNENNELFVQGFNYYGQLGLGDDGDRNNFVKFEHNFGNIKSVIVGAEHNIILNDNNELFVSGRNDFGQLGLGDNKNRYTYVKLNHNFGQIKNIYSRGYSNIILTMNNELFVCGYNHEGQLGFGDYQNRDVYVKLEHNFGEIKNIYCNDDSYIILNDNNELYVCGQNINRQLGLGDIVKTNIYIKLEHNFGKIKNIYCGGCFTIILNENNELYVCGDNYYGQLGLGHNDKKNTFVKLEHNFGKIKDIYCNDNFNIILNEDNELFTCGYNRQGQLGLGDNFNRNYHEKVEQYILKKIEKEVKNLITIETDNMIIEL
jgi:alpha-tubulin suppressor-like RCC1 family protein